MKTKITVVALITATAGMFAYTRPHNAIPSDLRDAVADGAGNAFGDLKGAYSSGADVPVPVPAAEQVKGADGRSLAAPGSLHNGRRVVRQCFAVGVSLDPSMFRGDTAAKTRTNVERALSAKGFKLLYYSDDYEVSYLEFSAAREEGMLGFTSNRGKIEELLKDIPEVKRLSERGHTEQELFWTVYLKEPLYPPRIERVFSSFTVPHRVKYNNVHDTLTIELEAGSADPSSALYVLKTLPGIKIDDRSGMKRAQMFVVTFYSGGSDTEALGWAGCVSGNCKAFDSRK